MNGNIELVTLMQAERQRYIQEERLARLVAAIKECCSPTRIERLVRAVRRTPATV